MIVVGERKWEMAERVDRTQIGLLRPNANPNATLSLGSSLDPILQGSGTVDYLCVSTFDFEQVGRERCCVSCRGRQAGTMAASRPGGVGKVVREIPLFTHGNVVPTN